MLILGGETSRITATMTSRVLPCERVSTLPGVPGVFGGKY